MPLFHQRTNPDPVWDPQSWTVGEKKVKWAGKLNRYQSLGLSTDRSQEA